MTFTMNSYMPSEDDEADHDFDEASESGSSTATEDEREIPHDEVSISLCVRHDLT